MSNFEIIELKKFLWQQNLAVLGIFFIQLFTNWTACSPITDILMVLLLANPAAHKNKMSYWKNKIQRLKVIVSIKEKFPVKKLSLDDVVCDWNFCYNVQETYLFVAKLLFVINEH